MNYATFRQRLNATVIDCFVFLPLILIQIWLGSYSKTAAIALVIPMAAISIAYDVYCHARFGQTIGKYAMGIHVVRISGARIGWREAWLRAYVNVAFITLGAISSLVALATIADAEYYAVGWTQLSENLHAYQPAWLGWTTAAINIWTWSEVVVMLFNKKRRSLHDFIAGTVVIAEPRPSAIEQTQSA